MKFALISLGCPKNQVDADVMCRQLLAAGHTTTDDLSQAECIIVNTCGFIDSAKEESIENILTACAQKQNHGVKVVVTGCLAERYREEVLREIPEVDAVVGIGSNKDICDIISRLEIEKGRFYGGEKSQLMLGGKRVISTPGHYAYLKISEGCNNRCSYCAIPLIRGNLRSRDMNDIIEEAKWLAEQGVREIILVAQDITAYGDDSGENKICKLLKALNEVEGIRWIRLLYAYPERITDEFIKTMAECDKVLKYLDVPVQHINTRVLKSMNRKGTRETVESALNRLREAMPDIVLRTTLIAGFPGETEQEFDELCDFVKKYRFDRLGCFAYSREENTPAAEMPNQIDEEIKNQRADTVMRIQTEIMAQKQAEKTGTIQTVIVDDYDSENDLFICRTAADAPDIDAVCYVKSEKTLLQGEFYTVEIEESDIYDLFGYVCE